MAEQTNKSPLILLTVLSFISLGMYLLVPNIYLLIGAAVTGTDLESIISAMKLEGPQPLYQSLFLVVQGLSAFTSFILVPWLFLKYYEKGDVNEVLAFRGYRYFNSEIVMLITIVFMVVNAPIIEWNMNLQFPDVIHAPLKSFEQMAAEATKFLTNFYSLPYFMASIVVIAIIPAIGEELLFRGMIQRYGMKIFSNPHVAIWVTAFAFSAFHMQFFGFVPRMLLGALFGYLYFYSGNLWYSVIAHFTNNGFTILMMYLHQQGVSEMDIESTESVPWYSVAIASIVGIILFWFFVKRVQKR